ncbi:MULTISPECIES: GNAT family N-acetyltransferase [unclassified Amycolatopsis]|uniref:GNAT family N-acetyltransferase n=1 Tax=unclassified Amycolatopsis TaxID=2618356 RepID=UPI001C698558|nr:GNAT family N-acetyltransferase [Amycolatopsis sp. DSM 110486]QYN23481.1 GNAT family N-acetyltransferase [Amycolatopsis sp. DSM 110486]
MTDLVVRPLVAGEEHLFTNLPATQCVGSALLGRDYEEMAQHGEYRPEWTWIAARNGKPVARAAWWASKNDEAPLALDWFDFTDFDAGVEVLRQAPFRAEYSLTVPPGWRDDPAVKPEVETRIEAAEAAGMEVLVERYRYTWTVADGLPERPRRLEFRAEPQDDKILAVFRRVHQGSLDAHVRRTTAEHGLDAAAQEDLDLLRRLPSPRDWWRLAYTPEGDLVGLTIPARNPTVPIVAYVGVVPEQRGHNYAYDLLVEATHELVGHGAETIVAATDVTNKPMAAAFAKAGYPVKYHRIDLV